MEKIINAIFKYADKKTIPLMGLYAIVIYYAPILGEDHILYSVGLIIATFLVTLLYMFLLNGRSKLESTKATLTFIENKIKLERSKTLDCLRYDDPDKEMAVQVFLISMLDEIQTTIDELIKDKDYGALMQRTLNVKEKIRKTCIEHNVPLEIYYHIHELNEKRVTQFYVILDYVIGNEDRYSDSEKFNLIIVALYHFVASLIDSTIEAGDDMNGSFTKTYAQYKTQGKYIIPIK
jgi:hypothetical protein